AARRRGVASHRAAQRACSWREYLQQLKINQSDLHWAEWLITPRRSAPLSGVAHLLVGLEAPGAITKHLARSRSIWRGHIDAHRARGLHGAAHIRAAYPETQARGQR